MRRVRRCLYRARNNRKGSTMVETVVSLLLTAIIMIATTASLLAGYELYRRIQTQSRAVELAIVLCDDIQSELNKCYGYVYGEPDTDLNCASIYKYDTVNGKTLPVPQTPPEQRLPGFPSADVDMICFQGISGNNTCITVSDGKIVAYYPDSGQITEWKLGGDAYYGLTVSALNFSWLEKDGSVVAEVKMVLSIPESGWSHSVTRYVICQNLHFPEQDGLGNYDYRINCCKTVRYQ